MDLSTKQWNDIEQIFQEYDCSWRDSLLSSPLFRILHQQDLFASCDGNIDASTTTEGGKPLSWLIQNLEKAV
jgi:hypothetical protein